MKRKKKKLPAERFGIEVRYAYDGNGKHKTIAVSTVKVGSENQVLDRNIVSQFGPTAKKKAVDAAKALSFIGRCDILIVDENLMREEYLSIHPEPMLISESK